MRSIITDIQADKQNTGKGEFLKKAIHFNNTIISDQYYQYLKEHGVTSKSNDSIKIMDYLLALNKQKQFEHLADSLLSESNLAINLKPGYYDKVTTDNLDYHELSEGKKISVYIISDYNCHACQNAERRLRKIINKYGQHVGFRFVYYSEYIAKKALIAEAAANQGKFVEMHDFLFDHPEMIGENPSIFEFAKQSGLNIEKFEKDALNPETLKNLIINKQKITKQNIYVTPSFVINNKLINDEFSLYILENLINEELEKEK